MTAAKLLHLLTSTLCYFVLAANVSATAGEHGKFQGELVLKPTGDGVNMKLVAPFGYVDAKGRKWLVPAGTSTDGASIPQSLWSFVGSPFTGKYLAAAVVHDHFCRTKYRSWAYTHEVFYEAMLSSGVPPNAALLMWAAVYRFGPRWARSESHCWTFCSGTNVYVDNIRIQPDFLPGELRKIQSKIDGADGISIEALKDFIDKETFSDEKGEAYGAKWEGFVGGADEMDDADPPNARARVNGKAPGNWFRFGTEDARGFDAPVWRVIKVPTGDTLKMRAGPGSNHREVGGIPAAASGVKFVSDCDQSWCEIEYDGKRGWINTSYVQIDMEATAGPTNGR